MPDTAIAPYAQAAAVVTAGGAVVRSQGVVGVTHPSPGFYVIEVDASIEVDKSVPIAVLWHTRYGGICINRIVGQTIHVSTCNLPDYADHDYAFHLIVP
ncbi:hypothetical protein EKH77_26985 [Streptomyces luteoverticillatus]|uniref:Uncharacterized protein n=1 Tax=Streptomyces luteoverticillatus TaxID=66425 RepID=A0A3Q9FXX6_STRLT|nr:hypothetical protein [Streptomyces luteoverticillatus]AZQ74370.1 hypothetical protein EKH77_26985 [Streptomyces luteoverticillatus]